MTNTLTNALQAAHWAIQPNVYNPEKTNFEVFLDKIDHEYSKRVYLIKRNQISIGMSNNYWPCLSRLAIMACPWLAEKLKPRHIVQLDSEEGIEFLNKLYLDITGKQPIIYDWRNARKKGA